MIDYMKEALFYKGLDDDLVGCFLCPRCCVIKPGSFGYCRARKNVGGLLYSLVYGKPCSVGVDPIEKKPLFHFLPGSSIFSIGTAGCNFRCKNCQNFEISQATVEDLPHHDLPPEKVVDEAIKANCKSIAYTYTEPTVFGEYVIDTSVIAHSKGLRNVLVTNGYTSEDSFSDLYRNVDAANVDLKGFSDDFYKKVVGARLQPVLDTLLRIKDETNTWLEVTNLLIPTLNDSEKMIRDMCKWIVDNLGPDVPLHFSRFFSMYKLENLSATPESTLTKARDIARGAGLNYVYIGNFHSEKGEYTVCPECKEEVIKRDRYSIEKNDVKDGKCVNGHKISGVWE